EKTARIYTDFGMFTSRETVGKDASLLFNYLSGYSSSPALTELFIAPDKLRQQLMLLIRKEMEWSKQGKTGRIIAKMNALTDKILIQELYAASQAGVQIDLVVRGICCLRPGIKGVSENIRVVSIVGTFLEHSRVFYFHHGGEEKVFLASADWMTRNMDRRVELLIPVHAPHIRKRLTEYLAFCLQDNVKARILQTDGSYRSLKTGKHEPFDSQRYLQEAARQVSQDAGKRLVVRTQGFLSQKEQFETV
ncbi:MAG: RNA degradosome polyphosphate kinase, partial [Clostridia bacterium]